MVDFTYLTCAVVLWCAYIWETTMIHRMSVSPSQVPGTLSLPSSSLMPGSHWLAFCCSLSIALHCLESHVSGVKQHTLSILVVFPQLDFASM